MKIVKEHIFEKFTEDSDPIHDMGIGIEAQLAKFIKELGQSSDFLLTECAKHGKLEFVRYLLKTKRYTKLEKDLALQHASKNGHVKIVKLLLQAGADVHTDKDYALAMASANGHVEVIKVLFDSGSDPNDGGDGYALKWAIVGGHAKVVRLLLKAGANVDLKNRIYLATKNGHNIIAKILKDHIKKDGSNLKENLALP